MIDEYMMTRVSRAYVTYADALISADVRNTHAIERDAIVRDRTR